MDKENQKKKNKQTENKVKELIEEIVLGIIGKSGEKIVDILYKKKNVNELLVSKKLSLTINQTRNILYKLLDNNLVQFIRKKDSKKGGWYTYFWTLNTKKSLFLLQDQTQNKIKHLQEDLEKRKNLRFYYSPSSNLEYSEEQALENNFICPETGEVMQLKDNNDLLNAINSEISKLKSLIVEVSIELLELEKKEQKLKKRKMKEEMKKKEEEKRVRRKKLEKERKKAKTKHNKKKSVKKSPKSKKKKK